jgi:hypothetical protein
VRGGVFRTEQWAGDVDSLHVEERIGVDAVEGLDGPRDAGVVDDAVEAAERLGGLLDGGGDGLFVGNVGLDGERPGRGGFVATFRGSVSPTARSSMRSAVS